MSRLSLNEQEHGNHLHLVIPKPQQGNSDISYL